MAVQMLGIKTKFTDDQGRPLIGGSVHTYYAGTSLPQDTFSDPELTVPNTNPVKLDDTGSANIFLKGTYRVRVFDRKGKFVEEQDNVDQLATVAEVFKNKGGLNAANERIDALTSEVNSVKEKTLVVESIADLSTIKNPKNGLRVFVKSYHAGLNKGGGYFTYDSSKSADNNTGTVINGWVRDVQNSGFLTISMFGAKSDGVTDDTIAIKKAIESRGNNRILIPGGTTCISDTIFVGQRGAALEGVGTGTAKAVGGYASSELKWIGEDAPRKAMLVIGQNNVGQEPTIDASAITVRNIRLNGVSKVGFLMYGTFLTNDSLIENIHGEGSTEYNFYFAKSWYCTIRRLYSLGCKHNGIALGMPLVYSDGTRVDWTTPSPLELNNLTVTDIRSISAGSYYSSDKPKTWKPNESFLMHGYGIGAGIGNGFRLSNFLSEASGGVNLYSYNTSPASKTVENGYLENACKGSGLDAASNMVNVYLDYSSTYAKTAGGHVYKDIFMNYNSGGILCSGSDGGGAWTVALENIHQPRFLKHIDSVKDGGSPIYMEDERSPLRWCRLRNVYSEIGYVNIPRCGTILGEKTDVNLRYEWSLKDMQQTVGSKCIFIKTSVADDVAISGTYAIVTPSGSVTYGNFPNIKDRNKWIPIKFIAGNTVELRRAGGAMSQDLNIDIRVVEAELSLYN